MSISKNVYIDKLDKIVNIYKNTYITIQIKPVNVKSNKCITLTLVKKLMIQILNLKLVTLLEYQNIKIFLQKAMFEIGLKKFVVKKVKHCAMDICY